MSNYLSRDEWRAVFNAHPKESNKEIASIIGFTDKAVQKARKRVFGNVVICATPGCDAVLGTENISGVCRDHNHNAYCRCKNCPGIAAPVRGKTKGCIDCGAPISCYSNSIRCRKCAPLLVGAAAREHNALVAALAQSSARGKWHANGTKLAKALGWPAPRNDPEARLLIAVAAGERDDVLAHKPHVAMRQAARRRLGRVQQSGAQPARSP